jgi:hypothetical protein
MKKIEIKSEAEAKTATKNCIKDTITRIFKGSIPETQMNPLIEEINKVYISLFEFQAKETKNVE